MFRKDTNAREGGVTKPIHLVVSRKALATNYAANSTHVRHAPFDVRILNLPGR